MTKIRRIIFFSATMAVASLPMWGHAETVVPTVSGDETGVWLESFVIATNRSIRENIPLVLLWGNAKCEECNTLETAVQTESFRSWQRERQYLFCAIEGEGGKDVGLNAGTGARDFCKTAGGTRDGLKSGFPYVCLYWPKSDGTVSAYSFTGRRGMMFSSNGQTVDAQLKASADEWFSGYMPEQKPDAFSFVVGDTTYDRLEVEPDTAYVDVPVAREIGVRAAVTNSLVAAWPDSMLGATTNKIVWSATETLKYVRVNLSRAGKDFPAGKKMTLTLTDVKGEISGTGAIHFVEKQANSLCNPAWLGEDFSAGEWTMDLDRALARTKNGEFDHLLLFFTAVFWCPHCQGLEDGVFATQEFKAWCETNKIALVILDNPHRIPGDADYTTRTATGRPPTLLRYASGTNGYKRCFMSGASYMSRKSIPVGTATTAGTAEYILQRNRNLGYEWGEGNYCAPSGGRAGYPTVILLKPDGSIAGRFNRCERDESSSGGSAYAHPHEENMARLADLLLLAQGDGEADNYLATTQLSHAAGGKSVSTLQINDNVDYYLVNGIGAGELTVKVEDASRPVQVAIVTKDSVLASGMDSVRCKLDRSAISAGGIYIKVSAYPDRSVIIGGASSFDATIATTFEPALVVDEATCYLNIDTVLTLQKIDAPASGNVGVRKVSGSIPSGMKLAFDASLGAVVLKGIPKKSEECVFAYTVSIDGAASSTFETKITTVASSMLNGYLMVKQVGTVPLYDSTCETRVLAGVLTLNQTAKNKITAKYEGTGKKKISFSGAWQSLDDDGTAHAVLTVSAGQRLSISMDHLGRIEAEISGLGKEHTIFRGSSLSGTSAVAQDLSAYVGYYTVTLPTSETAPTVVPTGTGYLTLTITGSSASSGKVKYTGKLPNGSKINGTAMLVADSNKQGFAILPIVNRSGKDVFTAAMSIRANGASLYRDSETVRIVLAENGTSAYWAHIVPGEEFETFPLIWGGWYAKNTTPKEWMSMFGLGEELVFAIDHSLYVPGDGKADVTQAATASLIAGNDGKFSVVSIVGKTFSISFKKATGVVSGKAELLFPDGKRVTGSYEGVLLPGWIDCQCYEEPLEERPFASGAFVFTDSVNGRNVKCSLPFDMRVPIQGN